MLSSAAVGGPSFRGRNHRGYLPPSRAVKFLKETRAAAWPPGRRALSLTPYRPI